MLALHNPLVVPELLCDILDRFYPEIYPIDAQALLALACTCRMFSEPSLDRLWKKLYSLKPLIYCYTRAEDAENTVPPTSSQLTIIGQYSRRIRELTVFDWASIRFLQCMSMRPARLFPNLTALHWNTPHVDDVPIIFIQRLLSSALVSLEATLSEADGVTLLSFLDSLSRLCGNLKSIKIRFSAEAPSKTTIHALSRAICSQKTLEDIVLHVLIDEVALKYLSTLPTLKSLSAVLSKGSYPPKVTFLPTDPLFCNAELLEFSVWDLDLVPTFLRPRDQKFHTFRLYHHGRQTSDAVLSLLNVLASRPCTIPLLDVSLSFWDPSHPIPPDQTVVEAVQYRLSYKELQPLTTLGFLRELMIEWSDQVSLDDYELANLARNWPSLQVFYVYCGRGGHAPFPTKYVTLQGLLWLVHLCPRLHTVGLPLDATQVPVANEAEPRDTNFTCLVVPESPIDEPLAVAVFLSKYLPCVTALDARFLRPPGTDTSRIIAYERAWQQVECYLGESHSFDSDAAGSDSEGTDD